MGKFLLCIILIFACYSFGQSENCPMPALQNIMPGMTFSQAEKQINRNLNLKADSKFRGLSSAKSAIIKNTNNILVVRFYNSVVYSVDAIYDNSIAWKDLVEFAETSVKNLELPVENLRYKDAFNRETTIRSAAKSASLRCGSSLLIASETLFGYMLSIGDVDLLRDLDNAYQTKLKEIQERTERKKKTFKP